MLDAWQEILAAVRRNKLRALLTAASVFWGIFMLVVMLGLGKGLERGTRQNAGDFAIPSLYVWSERTSLPYRGRQPGRYLRFRNADVEALARIPGVARVAPRINVWYRPKGQAVYGSKAGAFPLRGDTPDYRFVEPLRLSSGRFLNDRDLRESRKVALVGEEVRRTLFGEADPVGRYFKVDGVFFRIVGLVDTDKGGEAGNELRTTISIPFTTFQRAFHQEDRVGWFALTLDPAAPPERVEAAVKRTLAARHDVHPADPQALASYNAAEKSDRVVSLFRGIGLFVWFVGTLTLLAGVLGVSNILLVTVRERTREIGIRKALGATPRAILSMILKEAVVLTSMAGYAGLVAGVGALELVDRAVRGIKDAPLRQPEVDFRAAVLAAVILVLSGVLAGLLPARHAARIHPVEALRAE